MIVVGFMFWAVLTTPKVFGVQINSNVPQSEIDSLQDLYDSTNGSSWQWEQNGQHWNFSGNPNPCMDWQGVNCSQPSSNDIFRHIYKVYLPGFNMYGTIPPSIGNLTFLSFLNLENNQLWGTIPEEMGASMMNLTSLNLQNNYLTGSIPATLGQLKALTFLSASYNSLVGTISDSFGMLTALDTLCLSYNTLSGSIPSIFRNMTELQTLQLNQNALFGSIPINVYSLDNLYQLDLSNNLLTGTLPLELSYSNSLAIVNLSNNLLSGTLPLNIAGSDVLLYDLFLTENQLSGSIPEAFCAAVYPFIVNIASNSLTGTIPACIGNLSTLVRLDVSSNLLTSTIPSSICEITGLQILNLNYNSMSGSQPRDFGNITAIYQLYLQSNFFTGTVPARVWQQLILTELILNDNMFTGTIAATFGTGNEGIADIGLRFNFFAGSIPNTVADILALEYLDLGHNLLTSTLPESVAQMQFIITLDVQDNFMTGCLPPFGYLDRLISLQLLNNRFACSLDGVFSGTLQPDLLDVDFSYNRFTGTVPTELLSLPQLSTVVATSNCFTGTLPEAICSMKTLRYLILDGLHTSPHCRHRISQISHSYVVYNGFHGTIPPCIFTLPELSYFHMSGNKLSGSLPANLSISEKVTQLILSHNALTGPIPQSVQKHVWSLIDLSYNLMDGTLLSDFGANLASNASVDVQNNRLSGKVPSPLVSLKSISTLGSNMFSCDIDKTELPEHDENKENYQCGSDDFNAPYYALIGAIGVLSLALWVLNTLFATERGSENSKGNLLLSVREYSNKWLLSKNSLPLRCQHFYSMLEILCRLGVFCAAAILIVLVPWYVTASHYWGTYTHQYAWVVSAAFLSGFTPGLVEFFLFSSLVIGAILFVTKYVSFPDGREGAEGVSDNSADRTIHEKDYSSIQYLAIKCGVYGSFLLLNMIVVVGMNVAFVVVYLTQSSAVLAFFQILMSLFKFFWNAVCARRLTALAAQGTGKTDRSTGFFTLQVFIGLFNNIAVPCLVVSVLSPSCFYSVFNTPSQVTSTYISNYCVFELDGQSCYEENASSAYDPPFIYDYQCSSSFITFYAPPFVYLAIAAGIVTPLVNTALTWLQQHAPDDSMAHKMGTMFVPMILKPLDVLVSGKGSSKPLLDPNYFLAALLTYFGIMMTFGVVFPPIAAAMCFTMLSVSWQVKLVVGRLLYNAREVQETKIVERVEQECMGSAYLDRLRGGVLMVVAFGFAFYALFVFDTIGGAAGFQEAYWVLIVMPLISLCLFGAVQARRRYFHRVEGSGSGGGASSGGGKSERQSDFTDEDSASIYANAQHNPINAVDL